MVQAHPNFVSFVCRQDQEGWAALIACITHGDDISESTLHAYVQALGDTCSVSVLFSNKVSSVDQCNLIRLRRSVFAAGDNRIRVWDTDFCLFAMDAPIGLRKWACFAYTEAVNIASLMMTADTTDRQQAMIIKTRRAAEAIVNAFLTVKPVTLSNLDSLDFTAALDKAENVLTPAGGKRVNCITYVLHPLASAKAVIVRL